MTACIITMNERNNTHFRPKTPRNRKAFRPMPSLFRFLFVLGLIGGAAFVGMAALVAFVEPQPREMSQPISPALLNK
jgi:hypothetical protein